MDRITEAFTKGYCSMTFIDSLIVATPLIVIYILFVYFVSRKDR